MTINIYSNPTNPENHQELLRQAYWAAVESPDNSTQNGAIISLGDHEFITACNDFLPGSKVTPERLVRPEKYHWIEHAERAVIFGALTEGYSLAGSTLVCCWLACHDCARAIIQVGITKVVGHRYTLDGTPEHWKNSIDAAFTMFDEAGIEQVWIDGPIAGTPHIKFNGETFDPGKSLESEEVKSAAI